MHAFSLRQIDPPNFLKVFYPGGISVGNTSIYEVVYSMIEVSTPSS